MQRAAARWTGQRSSVSERRRGQCSWIWGSSAAWRCTGSWRRIDAGESRLDDSTMAVRRGAVVRPWEADMVMVKDDGYREGGMVGRGRAWDGCL
ncbi:hypothetical protein M0R45_019160 [Rubus argutus]|uniref:Uncharacterized protein n=1 Tax=Rubus argutus TaxID=59490 RepID=A0AAW1X4L9_RUBAR